MLASDILLTDQQSQWSLVVCLVQKGDMGEESCYKLITTLYSDFFFFPQFTSFVVFWKAEELCPSLWLNRTV